MMRRAFQALLCLLVLTGLAIAQTNPGYVPEFAIPIGKGPGVTGWGSAAPAASGTALCSNGPTGADPTFRTCLPAHAGTVTAINQGTGITLTPNPITTVGTVALTTPVTVPNGGTGNTTLTDHGLVIGQGTAAVSSTATGTLGQPILTGGSSFDPAPGPLSLMSSNNVTGQLGVANGGTGLPSVPSHAVVAGQGTSPMATVGPCASGEVLGWPSGASGAPACVTATGGTVTSVTAGSGLSGGAITTSGTIASYFDPGSITNCGLSASAAASALTIAIKDRDGSDPSASSPCSISFRNATATAGTYAALDVTAATSFTISSGSTLGITSSTAFRLWVVGFNDSGTFRLGAYISYSSGSVIGLDESALQSSTAEGGAGGADSAQTIYTGSAVSSKPMRVLGYFEWSSSGLTAGTWTTTNLNTAVLMGPGIAKIGDVVQTKLGTTSTQTEITSSTYQNTNVSTSITLKSAANTVQLETTGTLYSANAATNAVISIHRDSTDLVIGGGLNGGDAATQALTAAFGVDKPNSTSAIVYMTKLKSSDNTNIVRFPTTTGGFGTYGAIRAVEIMN